MNQEDRDELFAIVVALLIFLAAIIAMIALTGCSHTSHNDGCSATCISGNGIFQSECQCESAEKKKEVSAELQ